MELVNEWLRSHGPEVFVGSTAVAVGGMIWLLSVIIKGFWRTDAEKSMRALAGFKKKVEAMIDQAVKCAPPVEAKESEEGVPFEVYRKDLLRMVEQEISLDEFVDIWRGRKVQKRPKPGDLTAAEKAQYPSQTGCSLPSGVGSASDLINQAIKSSSPEVRAWVEVARKKNFEEYKVGQWVRVTRPSSPAVGLLGLIYKANAGGDNIRIEVRNVRDDPNFLGLMRGDFEIALPKKGEWWKMGKCSNSTCKEDPFDKNQKFITEPFEMKVDVFSKDPHVVRAHCGCMTPVNFGRGERST